MRTRIAAALIPLVVVVGIAAAQPNVWHVVNGALHGPGFVFAGQMLGPIGCENGAVAYAFAGDTDTGLCRPEPDELELVINTYPMINIQEQGTSRPAFFLQQDVTAFGADLEVLAFVGTGTAPWVIGTNANGDGDILGMTLRGDVNTATGWTFQPDNDIVPETDGGVSIGQVSGSVLRPAHIFLAGGAFASTIAASSSIVLGASQVLTMSATAPTISSGFGTNPSIVANNGTAAFTINVGTGGTANSGVIGLPAATTGWAVQCMNTSTNTATVFLTKQTATTTTTATIGNYDAAGAAAAWVASNVLVCSAIAY